MSYVLAACCLCLVWCVFVLERIWALPVQEPDGRQRPPPTLLISLDGLRADKLDAFLASTPEANLNKYFVRSGVKAAHMTPTFPSLTFPNHFTLVTGLYMESHGLTGNSVYDTRLDQRVDFLDSNDTHSLDAKWWSKAGRLAFLSCLLCVLPITITNKETTTTTNRTCLE